MNTKLDSAIEYLEKNPGKKLRTKLLHLVVDSYRKDSMYVDTVANSIEMVHNASLIIDDLPQFDNDDVRRGVKTIHKKYGEDTAILTSTYLVFEAIQNIASNVDHLHVTSIIDELASAGKDMCYGQSMEALEGLDKTHILMYNTLKTASLFKCICRVGAILADGDPYDWDAFGYRLGNLYQALDDIYDVNDNDKYSIKSQDIDINLEYQKMIDSIPLNVDTSKIETFLYSVLR